MFYDAGTQLIHNVLGDDMPQVVLITGANGGIGSHIASRCGVEGLNLVLNYHESSDVARLVCDRFADSSLLVQADVRKPDQVREMVRLAEERFGGIDLLVNNAGVTRDRTFLKMTTDEWRDVMETNLDGAFNVTQAVLPGMVARGYGRVINIASVVGEAGNFGQTNYAASKAALIGFTRALAKEVASKNVTVNAIAPGFINTPMTEGMPEHVREAVLARIPAGRFGEPDEVADAVAYLRGAAYVTGAILDVNGGLH